MSGIEVVGSIALFWLLGLLSLWLWVNHLSKNAESEEIIELKKRLSELMVIIAKYSTDASERSNSMLDLITALQDKYLNIEKTAEETKKLLNVSTMATAFIHKNKRTELT